MILFSHFAKIKNNISKSLSADDNLRVLLAEPSPSDEEALEKEFIESRAPPGEVVNRRQISKFAFLLLL